MQLLKKSGRRMIASQAGGVLAQAGNLISATINTGYRTKRNDRDFVGKRDRKSEGFIQEAFGRLFPTFAFFGEEQHKEGDTIDPDQPTWIVDPYDGTTNGKYGLPLTAVSAGLWFKGVPLVGAAYDIGQKNLYTAVRGGGAFRNGKRIRVSTRSRLRDSLINFDWPLTDEMRERMLKALGIIGPQVNSLRLLGSAVLGFCFVAEGSLDGYLNLLSFDWDIAAGKLLVEEAGGTVTDQADVDWRPGDKGAIASNGTSIHRTLANALMA